MGYRRPVIRPPPAPDLDAAVAAHKQAMADCETHRKVAEAAAKRLGERTTRANVAREKLARRTVRTDRRT